MFDPTNMLNIVPETTKEEALNPAASLVGQALKGIAHKILDPLVKYNIVKEQEMADFAEKVRNNTSSIPIEHRDQEKIGLTLKAVEDSSYQLNSEKLREMFANLIASTVDNRVNDDVHPSFSSVLKDFSTTDALLFEELYREDTLPVVTVRLIESGTGVGVNINENIILLKDKNLAEPVALNNLIRFGLIDLVPGNSLVSKVYADRYKVFEESAYFKEQESALPRVTNEFTFDKVQVNQGRIDITAFGKQFGNIVIS